MGKSHTVTWPSEHAIQNDQVVRLGVIMARGRPRHRVLWPGEVSGSESVGIAAIQMTDVRLIRWRGATVGEMDMYKTTTTVVVKCVRRGSASLNTRTSVGETNEKEGTAREISYLGSIMTTVG
jgi:hypothetical protein